ncbi:MAG: hypothetical protein QOG64_1516, partial [Acidimicrobiaceae bacterium]|nr:hypothetical protein [Acidimicrobiaceae bacterium]
MTATTEDDVERHDAPLMDPDEQRSALIRLCLIIGAGVLAAAVTGVTKTVAVILAIVVMIMLHELGHFATAKWADMKVTEYFLGFGPRLWSIRRGETEYGVKAIPAGGYVKIIGMSNLEEVAPEDENRTYRDKPYWRRLSVAVAGSTMHFLIALVLLWLTFSTVGIEGQKPELRVGELTLFKNGQSPAQLAGFKLGDKIVSVDGKRFTRWDDLPPYIQSHPNQQLTFVVERGGKQVTLTPTPVDRRTIELQDPNIQGGNQAEPSGFIGIGPSFPVLKYGAISSIGRAGGEFGSEVKQTLGALGSLVTFKGIQGYSSQLTGHAQQTPDAN